MTGQLLIKTKINLQKVDDFFSNAIKGTANKEWKKELIEMRAAVRDVLKNG